MKIIHQLLQAAMVFVDAFAGNSIKPAKSRIVVIPWYQAALRGQIRVR